jgi:hypothetical protein
MIEEIKKQKFTKKDIFNGVLLVCGVTVIGVPIALIVIGFVLRYWWLAFTIAWKF